MWTENLGSAIIVECRHVFQNARIFALRVYVSWPEKEPTIRQWLPLSTTFGINAIHATWASNDVDGYGKPDEPSAGYIRSPPHQSRSQVIATH